MNKSGKGFPKRQWIKTLLLITLRSLTKNYLLLISSIGNSSIYLFEQTDMAYLPKKKARKIFY